MKGISPHVQINVSFCILAYGMQPDGIEECLQIFESKARETMNLLCAPVVAVLGPTYLRQSTEEDLEKIFDKSANQLTLCLLGSIECTNWACKILLTAWNGQLKGKAKLLQ